MIQRNKRRHGDFLLPLLGFPWYTSVSKIKIYRTVRLNRMKQEEYAMDMEYKKILLDNIEKIHTTEMGIDRIRNNLKIDTTDVVEYCKNKILDSNCNIYKQGKNWYCEIDNIKITINSYSYTIITAHILK